MRIIGYLAPSLCALTRITHVVAQRWNCYCSTRAEFCFMKRRMHYPYNSSKQRATIHNRCHIFGYGLACKSKQQRIIGIDKHLRSHICWNRYTDTEHQLVSSVSQEIWAWFEIIFVKLHIGRCRITHETTRANHNVIIRFTFHFAFPKCNACTGQWIWETSVSS